MSRKSPSRRPDDDRDDDWLDADSRDNPWESAGRRIYASVSAPFVMTDGRHRLRALVLFALFAFSLLAARLIDIQVVRGEVVAETAQRSRMVKVIQPAERGKIYDATGVALAQSVPARDITADPYLVDNPADYAAKLSPLVGVPEDKIIASLQRTRNSNGREVNFAYVARKVPLDKWDAIKKLKLAGLFSEPASLRTYPSGNLAANVLGYTNAEGQGVAGLEAKFNKELAGVDGAKTYERSAGGGEIPTGTGTEIEPQPGASIQTTINRDLQWIAQQQINNSVKRFDADSATVVVMDVQTGRIPALAQAPLSDPNDQIGRKDELMRNNAVQIAFDPGSTGKVLTAAAVIEEGKADASTVFKVPNRLPRPNGDGEFLFRDDVDHPPYEMTFAGVLAQSSNIGTIQAAELIGAQKQYEYLKKFGMGSPTGLGLPQENPGIVPPLERWQDLTFPNISYGQGYSANAIQMASVFATVANKGVRTTPRIIDAKINPDGTVERYPEGPRTQVVSEETTKTLIPMMEQVVLDGGTAGGIANIDGYRVAGKTGTAQLYDPNAHGPGKGGYKGYVASFIGLAPADDPRLVVAVITHNPKREYFGGVTGGPVFKAVMTAALQMMQIPPSGSKSPVLELHTKRSTKGGPWNR